MTIRKEIAVNIFLVLFGAGFLLYTFEYPLDSLENPGPGVFPFVVGGAFLILAGWQLLQSVLETKRQAEGASIRISATAVKVFLRKHEGEKKVLIAVAVLALYLILMQWIGFFVSTFLLVIIASRLSGATDWLRPVTLSVGVSLFCYMLFEYWLQMSLPKGLLF